MYQKISDYSWRKIIIVTICIFICITIAIMLSLNFNNGGAEIPDVNLTDSGTGSGASAVNSNGEYSDYDSYSESSACKSVDPGTNDDDAESNDTGDTSEEMSETINSDADENTSQTEPDTSQPVYFEFPDYEVDDSVVSVLFSSSGGLSYEWPYDWPEGYPSYVSYYLAWLLEKSDDDQIIRVDFSFYDEAIMRSVTYEGKNLSDLYNDEYYNNYLPKKYIVFLYECVSEAYPYGYPEKYTDADVYKVALERNNTVYMNLYPEDFQSEKAFEAKLLNVFPEYSEVKRLASICIKDDKVDYAIFNQIQDIINSMWRSDVPCLDSEFYQCDEILRSEFSEKLYEYCKENYHFKNLTHADFLCGPCGYMTADLTVAEIRDIIKNDTKIEIRDIGCSLRPEGFPYKIKDDLVLKMVLGNDTDILETYIITKAGSGGNTWHYNNILPYYLLSKEGSEVFLQDVYDFFYKSNYNSVTKYLTRQEIMQLSHDDDVIYIGYYNDQAIPS